MNFKYIHCIGTELEGGWSKKLDIPMHDDQSFSKADFPQAISVGEVCSEPFNKLEDCIAWLKKYYPDYTCPKVAFHIHLSFKNISYYSQLLSSEFYRHFLQKMAQWAEDYPCTNKLFHKRIRGEIKYCRREWNGDKQVMMKEKGINNEMRRTHLNYCWYQKTMENRLFPLFVNVETAISALQAYINCVESYLDANPIQNLKPLKEEVVEEECQNEIQLPSFNFFNFSNPLNKNKRKTLNIKSTKISPQKMNKIEFEKLVAVPIAEIPINKPVMIDPNLFKINKPQPLGIFEDDDPAIKIKKPNYVDSFDYNPDPNF